VQQELQMLREEMELKSALRVAQQKYPEFQSFENYVMQEIVKVVEEIPEVEKLSWEDIIDKGFERLQGRMKTVIQNNLSQFETNAQDEVRTAYMEGSVSRKPQPLPPSFSRDEIARMSLREFLDNEHLINEALKSNRIR
jgi:hypothetical protein